MMALMLTLLSLQAAGLDPLIRDLGSEKVAERDRASTALRRLGRESLPALQEALRSTDAEVRGRASDILAALSRGTPGVRIFRLRNADPSEVAALLRAAFQGSEGFEATVDLRTRSIVVTAFDLSHREAVERIVADLDRDSSDSILSAETLVRRLKALLRPFRSRS